ncbi:hypothetical protein CU097_003534 [Rhizopus azygosporus]|uniref:Uncharacterized protein n=1 Tax=Rhizopus azygosporus TaxID=86630 RepID=A0A367ISG9_RHIAZ|nr:hypothetical protein CU097_003534 [Rhizopus azygosporus]
MPLPVKRFSLVEEVHEMVLLPSIVESLMFVKNELAAAKKRLGEKKTRKEKKVAKERIRPSFMSADEPSQSDDNQRGQKVTEEHNKKVCILT